MHQNSSTRYIKFVSYENVRTTYLFSFALFETFKNSFGVRKQCNQRTYGLEGAISCSWEFWLCILTHIVFVFVIFGTPLLFMWLCHWFWHDVCVWTAPCRATCDSAAVTLPCSVPLHETQLDPCYHLSRSTPLQHHKKHDANFVPLLGR